MINKPVIKRIIISRTDAIGDVILTLPLAGILKKYHSASCVIIFFGRNYTRPVIEASSNIDEFVSYDDFEKLQPTEQKQFISNLNADAIVHVFPRKDIAKAAKAAKIKWRIGTSHRLYHWLYCNTMVALGRKNSNLHEAELNIKLLTKFGVNNFPRKEIIHHYGLNKISVLPDRLQNYLDKAKLNVLLHPKSNASSRDWSLDNFKKLIQLLPADKYNLLITGSEKEAIQLKDWTSNLPTHVKDVSGKMTLMELLSFINVSDGIVAASTGPLHIAAALGKYALGIYPPMRPIHPQRWSPIGFKAEYLCVNKTCNRCKGNATPCFCINEVTPSMVAAQVLSWNKL